MYLRGTRTTRTILPRVERGSEENAVAGRRPGEGDRLDVIENDMKTAARRRCERDRVGGVQYLPKDNIVIITIIIVQPDTHKTVILTLVYRCNVW